MRRRKTADVWQTHVPEGSRCTCVVVAEMLLQSNSDTLHLLPALPQAWAQHGMVQGKKFDQIDIVVRGKQKVQLHSAKLSDEMYLYSLIVDGKVVETRRMIVEK